MICFPWFCYSFKVLNFKTHGYLLSDIITTDFKSGNLQYALHTQTVQDRLERVRSQLSCTQNQIPGKHVLFNYMFITCSTYVN